MLYVRNLLRSDLKMRRPKYYFYSLVWHKASSVGLSSRIEVITLSKDFTKKVYYSLVSMKHPKDWLALA